MSDQIRAELASLRNLVEGKVLDKLGTMHTDIAVVNVRLDNAAEHRNKIDSHISELTDEMKEAHGRLANQAKTFSNALAEESKASKSKIKNLEDEIKNRLNPLEDGQLVARANFKTILALGAILFSAVSFAVGTYFSYLSTQESVQAPPKAPIESEQNR